MPLRIIPLTDMQIKFAKPGIKPIKPEKGDKIKKAPKLKEDHKPGADGTSEPSIAHKSYRMFDGGGLYLEVDPSGGKWWRLKYRFDGKEKRISLGV